MYQKSSLFQSKLLVSLDVKLELPMKFCVGNIDFLWARAQFIWKSLHLNILNFANVKDKNEGGCSSILGNLRQKDLPLHLLSDEVPQMWNEIQSIKVQHLFERTV